MDPPQAGEKSVADDPFPEVGMGNKALDPWTRGFLVATCTRQHNMQGANSTWLTKHLDGGTFLMGVWQIQGLSWYFA